MITADEVTKRLKSIIEYTNYIDLLQFYNELTKFMDTPSNVKALNYKFLYAIKELKKEMDTSWIDENIFRDLFVKITIHNCEDDSTKIYRVKRILKREFDFDCDRIMNESHCKAYYDCIVLIDSKE